MADDNYGQYIRASERNSAVVLYSTGWYYSDETSAELYGPFESEYQALLELDRYCHYLDNGNYDNYKYDGRYNG